MKTKSLLFFAAMLLASCVSTNFQSNYITDVYVADFGSEDIKHCRPSDVDLSHNEAKEFFLRAKKVEYKVIHDHYNYAPCYIEGTLKYKSTICEWEIRAGATGHIKCGEDTNYFVCDTCEDLFKTK